MLVESVFGILGGGECGRVGTDEGNGPVSGVKAQGEESLGSLVAKLDHGQKSVANGEAHTVLSDLLRGLPPPEKGEILLPQGTTVSKAGFLEGSNVHLQSQQFVVDHCCLAEVANLRQVVRQTSCHGPHVPAPNPEGWLLSFHSCVVFFWCNPERKPGQVYMEERL